MLKKKKKERKKHAMIGILTWDTWSQFSRYMDPCGGPGALVWSHESECDTINTAEGDITSSACRTPHTRRLVAL